MLKEPIGCLNIHPLPLKWESEQIVGNFRIREYGSGFHFEIAQRLIPRRVMRKDKFSYISLFGKSGGFFGSQVKMLVGQIMVFIKISAFAEEHFCITCDIDGILAVACIDY